LRTLGWDLLFAGRYSRELARRCPFPLRFEGVETRCANVTDLPFPDADFDLVVSHEVFEHLPDVEAALRSLRRVMKRTGITYIYVHNFTSLSGGHHLAWKYPDREPSSDVPPWDHLRANVAPDIPSWINRWREHRYREAFTRDFEILDWIRGPREGEHLLEPHIRNELARFSEDELLTKGFVVVGRPLLAGVSMSPGRVALPVEELLEVGAVAVEHVADQPRLQQHDGQHERAGRARSGPGVRVKGSGAQVVLEEEHPQGAAE
jgi:SAM-dependent methyltransferase